MKFSSAIAVAAFAAVGSAQLDNIPQCALSCFIGPLTSSGCPELTDFECQCGKAEALFSAVVPCVQESCSAEDQATAISAVQTTCEEAGVPVEVPLPEPTEAAPTPSSAAPESSAPPAESSAAPPAESSAAPVPSGTAAPTPSANGTAPVPTPTVSEFPGAANQLAVGAGAIALAILAL